MKFSTPKLSLITFFLALVSVCGVIFWIDFAKISNSQIIYAQTLTCLEKCLKEYNRGGGCLPGPRCYGEMYGCYLEILNQGKTRDCKIGESCYCQNQKPNVDFLSLFVDPKYKENFEDYDDGKITEYDPLICEAYIYDGNQADQAEGRVSANVYARINDTRLWFLGGASCEFGPEAPFHKCIKKFKPEDIKITGGIRGKKLACEVIPRDAFQEGDSLISYELIVAQFNYFFIHLNPPKVTNYKEQYDFYRQLSAIDDTVEDTGKALYLKQECVLTKEDFKEQMGEMTLKELFSVIGATLVLPKIDGCIRNIDLNGDKPRWDPDKDRCIGMSDIAIGEGGGGFTNKYEDTVFISSKTQNILSHELGHTHGLCDEYSWLGKYNGYTMQTPCDNDYPSCCIDSDRNAIQKKLGEEEYKIFRDGIIFQRWIDSNIYILTDQQLLELRIQSPCANIRADNIRAECLYPNILLGYAPEGYALLKEDSFAYCCPPEKNKIPYQMARCCIKKEKAKDYGNNCYNPVKLGNFETAWRCAGMPLKEGGSVFTEDETNLTLPYRSIMGFGEQELGVYRYPSKAKYPLNPKR